MLASLSNSAALRSKIVAALVTASIGLAGCTEYEYDRPGTWQATGANEHNLRAMLVNPQDSTLGTGAITSRGDVASRAVTRLGNDRRRALLNVSVSHVGSSDSTPDTTSAGPAPGGSSSTGNIQ